MSLAKKVYNSTRWFRWYHLVNEMIANTDPEYLEYVRPKRRKRHLPMPSNWHDDPVHHQKTWKVKRRTQYHPEGRNAYQITTECNVWWYVGHLGNLFSEDFFKLQGIVINEESDWEKQALRYKVYGDQKEGFRSFVQMVCERHNYQMEFEYI